MKYWNRKLVELKWKTNPFVMYQFLNRINIIFPKRLVHFFQFENNLNTIEKVLMQHSVLRAEAHTKSIKNLYVTLEHIPFDTVAIR